MISIIIPTCNEAKIIRNRLSRLLDLDGNYEIIVADWNSLDGTRDILSDFSPRIRVVDVDGKGRARALNQGAPEARGDILLFLHIDTVLPDNAITLIQEAMRQSNVVGGGFLVEYDYSGEGFSRMVLETLKIPINFYLRASKSFAGDHAPFVTAAMFHKLKGFDDTPFMEDHDLIRRLKRHGKLIAIREPAIVSSRRYLANGVVKSFATIAFIHLLYRLGVSLERLSKLYRRLLPNER